MFYVIKCYSTYTKYATTQLGLVKASSYLYLIACCCQVITLQFENLYEIYDVKIILT